MKKEIISIFDIFNKNGINYFILRDYYDINIIYNSHDVDIFANEIHKKKINNLLIKNGWYTPCINDNKYPHKQYYKLTKSKIVKIDIVYGLYFGNNNYTLKKGVVDFTKFRIKNKINIANEKLALISLIFHILLDKEYISEKNYENLLFMLEEYKNKFIIEDDTFINIAHKLVAIGPNKTVKYNDFYKKNLNKFVKINYLKNIKLIICRKIKILFNLIYRIFSKKTISFIGVDGSGKSSTINSLCSIYNGKAEIVYMGEKNYQINMLKNLIEKKDCNIFQKIMRRILLKVEPFYRYFKVRYNKKVILFDRYVDDIYINCPKFLNLFLYRIVFPKSRIKIYLHCSTKISLNRKNDILDKKTFTLMKKRYDKFYSKKHKNTYIINTGINSQEKVLEKIIEIINEHFPSSML